MNFEETEVLYNVYRGILRNNRSFQPGKSTAVEYRMDCPEYADLLKKYPIEKIAGKGTDLQRAIRVLKYLSPKLTHSPWYDGHVDCNALALLDYSLDKPEQGINCLNKAKILEEVCAWHWESTHGVCASCLILPSILIVTLSRRSTTGRRKSGVCWTQRPTGIW